MYDYEFIHFDEHAEGFFQINKCFAVGSNIICLLNGLV